MNLKTEANNYVPPQTKNIADLDHVPVDVEIFEDTATSSDGEQFTYKYIVADGTRYRVPGIVLGGIKAILNKIPDCKSVMVQREGSGLQTRYFVMPYWPPVEKKVKNAKPN
ncbi:MAG: hypothetical protein KKC46_09435 [Proteobacteria bacterium]|nr:hypothetical protein [Pseudomonadota bacterium]